MWSSLFGTKSIIEKGTDAVISAGDKLFYTDEEKADQNLLLKKFHLKILEASEPFKVAQRLLAVWFSILFGIAFIIGLVATIFNMMSTHNQLIDGIAKSNVITIDLEPLFSLILAFNMGTIIAIIIAWYFSGGVINSFKGK